MSLLIDRLMKPWIALLVLGAAIWIFGHRLRPAFAAIEAGPPTPQPRDFDPTGRSRTDR